MEIIRKAWAGTGESSDAYVLVSPANTLEIEMSSVVYNQYAKAIDKAVRETLADLEVEKGTITINDKGALDCVIQARVETAIKRASEAGV